MYSIHYTVYTADEVCNKVSLSEYKLVFTTPRLTQFHYWYPAALL